MSKDPKYPERPDCTRCGGSGVLPDTGGPKGPKGTKPCPRCGGTGKK